MLMTKNAARYTSERLEDLYKTELHDRTEKRVDCKYLPLSHTKP